MFLSGRLDRNLDHDFATEPLANVTNAPFRFAGPRCWTQFRLNRSEVVRCLRE